MSDLINAIAAACVTSLGFVFILLALYERGQRKGLETAEKLYAPVIAALERLAREKSNGR